MLPPMLLAVGIVVGLFFPQLSGAMQPFALGALFLVVVFSLVPFARLPTSMLIGIDISTIRIAAWQLVGIPAILVAAAIMAKMSDRILLLIIVTTCAGSLFASPALAQFLQLDRRRALQCMMLSTLLMPLSLYAFLSLLRGPDVNLNIVEYAQRSFIFLVCPLVIFICYRIAALRMPERIVAGLENGSRWVTVATLIVFGIGMMHPVAMQLKVNPEQVAFYLVLVVFLSVAMFVLTSIVLYRFGHSEAATGAVLSSLRNVGLGFALVSSMTGPELDVYVGVSMLPIFIGPFVMQVLLSDYFAGRTRPA
jgi:bile acid:Na+ symporter, BASS family